MGPAMPARSLTRVEKDLIRTFALKQERAKHPEVVKVRLMPCGDVRAYCSDGYQYWVAPTADLLQEAREAKAI